MKPVNVPSLRAAKLWNVDLGIKLHLQFMSWLDYYYYYFDTWDRVERNTNDVEEKMSVVTLYSSAWSLKDGKLWIIIEAKWI